MEELQEKKLNILSLATGKPVRCFKPEGDVGEPIKVRRIRFVRSVLKKSFNYFIDAWDLS